LGPNKPPREALKRFSTHINTYRRSFYEYVYSAGIGTDAVVGGGDGGRGGLRFLWRQSGGVGWAEWVHYEGASSGFPEDIELFSDGTGVVDKLSVTWKTENKRIRILSSMFGVTADYNVFGYELVLVYDERHSARFIKKESLEEYKKKREDEEKKEAERRSVEAKRLRKETEQRIEKISSYFTDSRNGQKYRTVTIGGKTWMAQNLNYQTGKSWCYDDDNSNCKEYGRLYDWNTAKTVCPAGWHLPSQKEWNDMVAAAGGNVAGKALKSTYGWNRRENGDGTDDYGFSALPGGFRRSSSRFDVVDHGGYWWTATEDGRGNAYSRFMYYGHDDVSEYGSGKDAGYSVRCVMDAGSVSSQPATTPQQEAKSEAKKEQPKQAEEQRIAKISGYFTDSRDGQKYRTVTIDGKAWMAQNLNYQPQMGNSWCYGNDNAKCNAFGRLYDWSTASSVCPSGWKLPSDRDWGDLVAAAGGDAMVGKALKAVAGWHDGGNGEDTYGFSAYPGGHRLADGKFSGISATSIWWTNTRGSTSGIAIARLLPYKDDGAIKGAVNIENDVKAGGYVRCIQK
jgi:uncharacterized protein (TIGR02145 family)